MGLRINTNVAAINAQRNTETRTSKVNQSLERLSSGSRINKASDDAAGLAISNKMGAGILGFQQAKRNAMDGISMIQTAEGGLNETSNILTRLRELSVQAASDTMGNQERGLVNMEYTALTQEIDRISAATEFNGVKLLSGKDGNKGMDTLEFQVGIKNNEKIDRFKFDPNDADARTESIGIAGTGVEEKTKAQDAIGKIDDAINAVSGMRAKFGALQNRMLSTVSNISISIENMSSAQSRIKDTDIAVETSELAKNTILSQASAAVLQQANASGNMALKLIG
jgi:flagellin